MVYEIRTRAGLPKQKGKIRFPSDQYKEFRKRKGKVFSRNQAEKRELGIGKNTGSENQEEKEEVPEMKEKGERFYSLTSAAPPVGQPSQP